MSDQYKYRCLEKSDGLISNTSLKLKKRTNHRKESEKLSRTLSGIPWVEVLEKLHSTNEKEQRRAGWGIQKRIIKNSNRVLNCENERERGSESGFFKSTNKNTLG